MVIVLPSLNLETSSTLFLRVSLLCLFVQLFHINKPSTKNSIYSIHALSSSLDDLSSGSLFPHLYFDFLCSSGTF